MTVAHVEILVEEPSAEAFLRIVVPKIAPALEFDVYPSQGKGDLLKNLPSRLRAYRHWLPDDWRILILVDSDGGDCTILKNRLEEMAARAGLTTPAGVSERGSYNLVNRIVVQELEAWYFGDWEAVCAAFPRIDGNHCRKAGFRNPDAIGNTWEAFEKVLKRFGCMGSGRLPKILTAQRIAPHVRPDNNISSSFIQFKRVLQDFQNFPNKADERYTDTR